MITREFLDAGCKPTLFAGSFCFHDFSMVLTLLGAVELQLDAAQKGLMATVLILAAALLWVAKVVLVDRIGPERTMIGQSVGLEGLIAAHSQRTTWGVRLGVARI